MSKNRTTLARKQKTAVVVIAALLVVLAIGWAFAEYLASIDVFTDPMDNIEYTVKKSGGEYALFDKSGDKLETTVIDSELYYVTSSGTLVLVGDNGETEIKAVVDTDDGEDLSSFNNLMIYKKINVNEIQRIKVINRTEENNGSYTFERNEKGKMVIKGHDNVVYDQETYEYFASACSNSTTMMKISSEAVEKYGYEEYGLDQPQASMTITAKDGTSHTLHIGKRVVSENGYYVCLEGRKAVYIINSYIGSSILQPIEYFVSPLLHYGLSSQNYVYLYDFIMANYSYGLDGKAEAKILNAVTLWDLEDREGTEYQTQVYKNIDPDMDGYTPSTDAVIIAMGSFLELDDAARVVKFGADTKTRAQYGLDKPEKMLTYVCERLDGSEKYYFKHQIYFSKLNENGGYYIVSDLYVSDAKDGVYRALDNFDYIVEIDQSYLPWLKWERIDWMEDNYFQINIQIMNEMTFELPNGETLKFEIEHVPYLGTDGEIAYLEKVYAYKNGVRTPIDANNFKTLYINLLGVPLLGETDISDEEEEALLNDSGRHRLTWSFKTATGTERTHSYYLLASGKDYITINGNGGFYVMSSTVDKMAKDAVKVFNGEAITADSPTLNSRN